jgi:hypothetical protein
MRRASIAACAALAIAATAWAGGGAVEISQACVATGCGYGDSAGFPVQFSANEVPSSLVLTSDLVVPDANTTALSLPYGGTLDMAGFVIRGPVSCTGKPAACDGSGSGVGIYAAGGAIRNGTVRGMGNAGIYASASSLRVENVTLESNGGNGFSAYGVEAVQVSGCRIVRNGADGITTSAGQPRSSLVTETTIFANGGDGIDGTGIMVVGNMVQQNAGYALKANVGSQIAPYGQNGFYENNGGNANAQVVGGQSLGGNYCGDASC